MLEDSESPHSYRPTHPDSLHQTPCPVNKICLVRLFVFQLLPDVYRGELCPETYKEAVHYEALHDDRACD